MAWPRAKKIRKYRPGSKMLGIFDLISAFNQGRYVFVRGRAYHPAVLRNWSLVSLEGVCRGGYAFVAELTPEWVCDQEMKAELSREEPATIDNEFEEIGV